MYKDDRIDVTVRIEQSDYIRQMEIYAGRDGVKNPWISIIIQAAIILAAIAGAVFSLLGGEGRSFISAGLISLIYLPVVIIRAVNIPRMRKARIAQYEEAKSEDSTKFESQLFSISFGHSNVFARYSAWNDAIPYRSFSRCVEYSDGLYFERDLDDGVVHMIFIPARFLSAETAAQIISRVKAEFKRYTCVSQLRPADPPRIEAAPDGLFDLSEHKLLCEFEYTPTPEEIKKATGMKICLMASRRRLKAGLLAILFLTAIFVGFPILMFALDGVTAESWLMTAVSAAGMLLLIWALYNGNVSSVAKMQRKILQDEAKYGARVALYENFACIRVYGDDTPMLYNWLPEVFRTPEFVCIRNTVLADSIRVPKSFFAIPVRVLDDADRFVCVLEERIQAACDGAIRLGEDSSAATEELSDSEPLRKEIRRGKIILAARYKQMDVCIRRRFRVTELVIDGYVYAEQKELIEYAYELRAAVNGVVFCARQREDGLVQIFAQGFEIASGMHKI